MKIPNAAALDGAAKFVTIVNFIVFLVVFLGLYLVARHFIHNIFLRIICLIVAYFIASLLTFFVLKPLSDRAADAIRKFKK